MKTFKIAKTPSLIFGEGSLGSVEKIVRSSGWESVAVFTGSRSFRSTSAWEKFCRSLSGINISDFAAGGEPTPEIVDNAAALLKKSGVDAVIAIGGGSVIDAGKAVSAMIKSEGSIRDYLEGVGTKEPAGDKVPFIAVPTTSGTGSEATKNAVISSVGNTGFKKSLRHDNYVPDIAVIDPSLTVPCPPDVSAASGMDALTQLIESYVSTGASVFTDSLVSFAMEKAGRSLEKVVFSGGDIEARSDMAWASYVSGISLANAGLGVVHGIASPAGAYTAIPHGVVCGTLLSEATRFIIAKLFREAPESEGLRKYGEAGEILTGRKGDTLKARCSLLTDYLDYLTDKLEMPGLAKYGFTDITVSKVSEKSDGKNSPAALDKNDIKRIITSRL